jgi:transcriptional regulator with XRE-family HTH domain
MAGGGMNQLEHFGMRLRTVRKAVGITQEEAAEKARLNPKYLGQIERGEKRPSFDAIISLAKALQVKPTAFFECDQEEKDLKILRKKIESMLHGCGLEMLQKVYRITKVLLEP